MSNIQCFLGVSRGGEQGLCAKRAVQSQVAGSGKAETFGPAGWHGQETGHNSGGRMKDESTRRFPFLIFWEGSCYRGLSISSWHYGDWSLLPLLPFGK